MVAEDMCHHPLLWRVDLRRLRDVALPIKVPSESHPAAEDNTRT